MRFEIEIRGQITKSEVWEHGGSSRVLSRGTHVEGASGLGAPAGAPPPWSAGGSSWARCGRARLSRQSPPMLLSRGARVRGASGPSAPAGAPPPCGAGTHITMLLVMVHFAVCLHLATSAPLSRNVRSPASHVRTAVLSGTRTLGNGAPRVAVQPDSSVVLPFFLVGKASMGRPKPGLLESLRLMPAGSAVSAQARDPFVSADP